MKLLRVFIVTALFSWPSNAGGEEPLVAAKIIVFKSERRMELLDVKSEILKTYEVSLGGNPEGPKSQQGDSKTPEGIYKISGRNPGSSYHLSLRISYPNKQDIVKAEPLGVSPGGDIFIHGLPNGRGFLGFQHLLYDWTDGCIAVTNQEIEEIWNMVPDDTPIEIRP
jgi:murein L,D-transpeptidase YafK